MNDPLSAKPPEPALKKPSRKISKRRIEANRRNAQKSTGPRTPEGKAQSRLNALKHGYSGAGIVVHPEDQAPLRTRLEDWTRDLQPEDSVECWLVGRASLASVRVDRCARQEQARLTERVKKGLITWEAGERTGAAAIGLNLDRDPHATVQKLGADAFGCEWLIAQWRTLEQTLRTRKHWSKTDLLRALHLLEVAQAPTVHDANTNVATIWGMGLSVLTALDPDDVDAYRAESTAHLGRAERLITVRSLIPAADIAREGLLEILADVVRQLEERARQFWAGEDGAMKRRVAEWSLFDSSATAEGMSRYEKSNSSEVHRHLKLLFLKRREDASRQDRRAEAAEQRSAERREVAREVVALLKRRKAKRALREASPAAQTVVPAERAAAFPMPRPMAERLGESLGNGHESAPQNEATSDDPQSLTCEGSTPSVQSEPVPVTPTAAEPPSPEGLGRPKPDTPARS
jgi:hypothetical protein